MRIFDYLSRFPYTGSVKMLFFLFLNMRKNFNSRDTELRIGSGIMSYLKFKIALNWPEKARRSI